MEAAPPYYQALLRDILTERVKTNPRYSLRAFARSLQIQPGALSQILSGKRLLSGDLARRIFTRLNLSPQQEKEFLKSIASQKIQRGAQRLQVEFREILSNETPKIERELSGELFRSISDWYHLAILELTFVRGFKSDHQWIATQLGISPTEAKLAIDRLIALELLSMERGVLKKTNLTIDTLDKTKTSGAHRMRQKQILSKSIESLENDPIENRSHSSITFAIDPTMIPIAKKKIQKFIWDLNESLEVKNPKQVYELNISLFPLSKSNFQGEQK